MMSNVVEIRPVSARGVDKFAVPRDYFAVVDERGRECPILTDSIEKALADAESLECLGTAEKRTPAALRLVGNS